MRGVALRRKTDPQTATRLTEWLEQLRQDHADRNPACHRPDRLEWGRIAALRPRGDIDGLIAATAIVHEMILVTRNIKDFEDIVVSLINPWSSE